MSAGEKFKFYFSSMLLLNFIRSKVVADNVKADLRSIFTNIKLQHMELHEFKKLLLDYSKVIEIRGQKALQLPKCHIPEIFDKVVKNISSNPTVMKSLAISFSEWLNENYWVRDPFPNKHTEKVMWQRFDDEFKGQSKTAEQLYEMYQKEIGNVS